MSFNDYRNEVQQFMSALKETQWPPATIIQALEQEIVILKANLNDKATVDHQLYDLLFLLLELAAHNQTDLDTEWNQGKAKKKKYLTKQL